MTAEWLFERMRQSPDLPAIVWSDTSYSYGDLLDRMQTWRAELAQRGLGRGSVVLIDGSYSPTTCALLLALIALDAIAVPLTPQARDTRPAVIEIAEVQAAISVDDDDRWTYTAFAQQVRNPLTRALLERRHPGLVIFSSGSTGQPKGILHDFAALLEKYRTPRRRKSTLALLLFDHIGGIDTLFNTLANGGTLVTVPNRKPETVCRAIESHNVHTLPASPTFLNLLLISQAYRRYDLSCLEVIGYGTEAMPETTLQTLHEVFPHVHLVQTYGLSELGVLRTRSLESGSLWLKFSEDGFQIKIIDGTLWVRTPTAMLGYLNAPELLSDDGWLNTQDAVEVRGDYLRILGRATELINVGGQKVYPAEVESVLLGMDNVGDVAVYGRPNALSGQIVAARFNLIAPEELASLKRRMRAFCRNRLETYKIPMHIEVTSDQQYSIRFKKLRQATLPDTALKEDHYDEYSS